MQFYVQNLVLRIRSQLTSCQAASDIDIRSTDQKATAVLEYCKKTVTVLRII
jgi:hypothetical protein